MTDLQVSTGKITAIFFHLDNHMATQKLCIQLKKPEAFLAPNPVNLGMMLDRTLSYEYNLQKTASQVSARCSIFGKLAGTT